MPVLKENLRLIPSQPGIYKFFDKNARLLYIGKAKNLKNRVASYFAGKSSLSGRIRLMVSRIDHIEYTIVESESEALLLENSLIKKHQPKFNINLKDGKTYPLICIKNEHFPRVFSTRTIIKDGSEYYGPFVSGLNKNTLLEMLQRSFFIRTCNYNLTEANILKKQFRVCLSYHIGICKGPCEGLQSEEEYLVNIENVRNILRGKTAEVIDRLKLQMKALASSLQYERANETKAVIEVLAGYKSKSVVVNPKLENIDVFSIYSGEKISIVNYLKISAGSIIITDTLEFHKKMEEDDNEILQFAISEFHERYQGLVKEIIVPFIPAFRNEKIRYLVPRAGDKKKLLELSYKNALYYYSDIHSKNAMNIEKEDKAILILEQLKKDLDLQKLPNHIECFDNSNLQGSFPVSSMVVFRNGRPSRKEYRHFNVKTVKQIDDFATMQEVVTRRYKRLLEEGSSLPDLIIVDGGKGQLNAAFECINILGMAGKVEIIGIAKRLEEIYKYGDPLPLSINKKTTSSKFIQRIRNEAHRFGISHHRKRRLNANLKTQLTGIDGIGDKTARKLLAVFKSVNNLRLAEKDEIVKIVGNKRAETILKYFSNLATRK